MKSNRLFTAIVALLLATMVQAQTEKMSINDSWRFHLGDVTDAASTVVQDKDWDHINLPHTWNTDAYTVRNYHQGIGWYRKMLQVPQRWQGKRIYLYFEEVNREPVVYHWTYKMDEISVVEATAAGVKSNEDCAS